MLDSIPVVYRASARRRHKRRVLRHAPLEPWETRGVSTRWAPLGGPTVTCPEVVLLLDLPWGKKRARSVEALMLPDQRALAEMLFYIDIEVCTRYRRRRHQRVKSLQVGMEPSQSPSRTQGATPRGYRPFPSS